MTFSEKLKQLRNQKGVSQTKLAADIHISRSAVAKWENGRGMPNDDSLQLLAEYFGVTTEELNGSEGEMQENKTPDAAEVRGAAKPDRTWLTVLTIVLCAVGVLVLAAAVIAVLLLVTFTIIGYNPVPSITVLPG